MRPALIVIDPPRLCGPLRTDLAHDPDYRPEIERSSARTNALIQSESEKTKGILYQCCVPGLAHSGQRGVPGAEQAGTIPCPEHIAVRPDKDGLRIVHAKPFPDALNDIRRLALA